MYTHLSIFAALPIHFRYPFMAYLNDAYKTTVPQLGLTRLQFATTEVCRGVPECKYLAVALVQSQVSGYC